MTFRHYARIVNLKAGSLAAAACRVGAIGGGGKPIACNLLTSFGFHLGIALQIENDIRSLKSLAAGKGDWREGKRTFPILFALRYNENPRGQRFAHLFESQRDRVAAQEEMIGLLEELGAFRFARRIQQAEVETARRRLVRLKKHTVDTSGLERLIFHP